MTHTRMNLFRIALVLSAELAASYTVQAQCVSGWGATPARLATQNWAGAAPLNLTTYLDPTLGYGPLPQFSDIAVDSKSNVFLLSSAGHSQGSVWNVSHAVNQAGDHFLQVRYALPSSPGHLISSLFPAGGAVWAASSDGYVYNLSGAVNPSALPAPINLGGSVLGATYDGTYVWFAVKNRMLQRVQLPPVNFAGNSGTLAGGVNVPNTPSGPMVFDGRYLWYASGSTLVQFDPATNTTLSTSNAGGTISSLTFDGVYLWMGNGLKAALGKFDPDTLQMVTNITPGGVGFAGVVFDGTTISGFSSQTPTITKVRACDGKVLPSTTLPGLPLQEAFDGSQTWILYAGNNTITIR